MAGELRLECLGGLQITHDGAPVTGFVSVKAPALLCYLAVTGRPQFRLVLAGLLWADLPEEDACANLRKVLSNLRDLVGDHLIITPHTAAFDRQSAYWLDVEAFLERVERGQDRPEIGATGSPDAAAPLLTAAPPGLPHLLAAAELYRGDFLDGFYVRHAPLFEEWVLGQREGLRRLAGLVLKRLADHYAGREDLERAIAYTARLLALEPWQEEAHRQMMALLARKGERSAALAQYETCRRLLQAELHVEPTIETTALYRRIRATGAARPHNLPAPVTSFVGRADELALIAERLADPHCRLLSILGPGGVGKTRLAREAAAAARDRGDDIFLDGVFFIPLSAVRSLPALAAAVASALGLACPAGADPQTELLRRLRDRYLLLVLDGFEHLAPEASFLTAILQYAAGVKLLVTSQQRLHLAGEWVLELAGLPYAPLGPSEGVEIYSAIQLFLQRAQQARPDFAPSARDLQVITFICELVEGSPLAIELAAALTRFMSCAEIAQAVESSLDALVAFEHDLPARHRSIRAAFEHSWRLLTSAEQQALRRLAALHGEFTAESAEQAASVSQPLLIALADKSLLRRGATGRYALHELLRRFVVEKQAESARPRPSSRRPAMVAGN
jgi:DNA-binding SARP family transcriptional activator/predicted ATPase